MRNHHALATAVSLPVFFSALALAGLAGCTVGAAAGVVPPVVDESSSSSDEGTGRHFKMDQPPATSETTKSPTWTVFVAGQGDNLHSPEFAADIAGMVNASVGANVKVVVLADYNAGFLDAAHGNNAPLYSPGSHVITIGGDAGLSIAHAAEQDSDDPNVLKNAITSAFLANPADHHAVIIWSRGVTDATHILGGDTQDGTRPMATQGMNVTAMQNAIRAGLSAAGITAAHPLDVIGFDTSSAGRIEDAYAMRDLAKVYIANASADGNRAWAYQEAFSFLGKTPTASAADFAKAENDAWQKEAANHGGSLARAHVAFDTAKLEKLARATDSFVQATQMMPSSLPHVARAASQATIDAGGVNRRPDFKRFFDGVVASPTNMGIVTTAAQNAADVYASAFIGTPGAAGFTIGLPSPGDLTNGWYNDYLSVSADWFAASRWNFMLATWSSAQDRTPFSIETSIEEDGDGPATITIGSPTSKIAGGSISAALVYKSGATKIAYGSVANGRFDGTNASLSWNKRVAVVDGQPARAIMWATPDGVKTVLAGRISMISANGGTQNIDAAVLVDGGGTDTGGYATSFIFNPESSRGEGFAFSAASIWAIDPNATFTPSLSQTGAGDAASTFGSPIAITVRGIPVGSTQMAGGNYEVQITAQDAWGISSYAMQPYSITQ